jgi:hypothetical protein
VTEFNYQEHRAHREREDGKRGPATVLGWVRGTVHEPPGLHRVFCSTRFGRRIYGEQGLPMEQVAIWLYGEST